ncbi:MAG TPA: hypothetical protein DET40_19085 [Lentisphaeria bacterium]|nr:MAG: hypothetical protein A2X45_25280 [Lentisphaerae bacterium GWF2_50_93]HCE45652.1 hypothetical protein [Lentisphaeria bacterium]
MPGIKTFTWRGEKISSLVLGTVQLGLDYGIANSQGRPSDEQATELVGAAWKGGISFFDTAQAYGDSETVLGKTMGALGIANSAKVISKISPALSPKDLPAISASVEESINRLGVKQLWGLMLHRTEWLDSWKEGLGELLEGMRKSGKVRYLGVSVYSPEEAKRALETEGIDMIQVPCSAWDQRMTSSGMFGLAKKMDKLCFVRSIYLQGLLLMSPDEVQKKIPSAYKASMKWCSIAREHGLTRAELAAKFAKSLDFPVVAGMENAEQAKENIKLFSARALGTRTAHEIRDALSPMLTDEIINPSKWNIQK